MSSRTPFPGLPSPAPPVGSLPVHLATLSQADLATLLRRRPETAALVRSGRIDLQHLAEAISQPQAVSTAIDSLDAFLHNLLLTAAWLGPDTASGQLAAVAPGVDPAALLSGAQELARWGLAFPVPLDPSHPRGDWALQVPSPVLAEAMASASLGPRAELALPYHTAPYLAAIAANLAAPVGRNAQKSRHLEEICRILSSPSALGSVVAQAPPKARQLLDDIRANGDGWMEWRTLIARNLATWMPWRAGKEPTTPADWLESRGLLVQVTVGSGSRMVAVPAEVEIALRGGRLFPRWPAPTSELAVGRPSGPGACPGPDPLPGAGDPMKVLDDMEALLGHWGQEPPPTLQKGSLGVRELRKAAKSLGVPEPYTGFLYALAVQGRLVCYDHERRLVPSEEFSRWALQPAPDRWARLFESWLTGAVWVEGDGLVDVDRVREKPWLVHARRRTVIDLAALAPGQSTDAATLGRHLAWRLPAMMHCDECALTLAHGLVQSLEWLGAATSPEVCLLEPARSSCGSGSPDPQWTTTPGPARAAFPDEVDTCLVGADLSIVVPGPPSRELATTLCRFADLAASSPARVYRLSEGSLRRGLDAGLTGAGILDSLRRHAPKGIPQAVTYLVEDVARRHGHLQVGRAGLYIRSADPALLAGVVGDRRLKGHSPRLLAPTVASVTGDDPEALLAALRSAGYLPVADPEGLGVGVAGHPVRSPVLPPTMQDATDLLSRAPLTAAVAAGAAEAILTGKPLPAERSAGPAPAGSWPPDNEVDEARTNPGDILALIEEAIEDGQVIEISSINRQGRREDLLLEPYEICGPKLHAEDFLLGGEKSLLLSRITSARIAHEVAELESLLSSEEPIGAVIARLFPDR